MLEKIEIFLGLSIVSLGIMFTTIKQHSPKQQEMVNHKDTINLDEYVPTFKTINNEEVKEKTGN